MTTLTPMDDTELLQLARMALEAEDLGAEGAGAPPRLRLAGAGPSYVRAFRFAGGLIAAAAALAFVVVIMAPRPQGPLTPPIANRSSALPDEPAVTIAEAAPAPDQTMLLIVYQDPDGACDCAQWKNPLWARGKRLTDVGRKELLDTVMHEACSTSAERAVVFAVSGPQDSLSKATHAMEQVANRLASIPTWHEDLSAYANAALTDLPKGTTVAATSLAMNH
jgi:hypothetical protein